MMYEVEILTYETRTFYLIYNVAADNLATQGARALATVLLIRISQNILVSAPEGLTHWDLGHDELNKMLPVDTRCCLFQVRSILGDVRKNLVAAGAQTPVLLTDLKSPVCP